MGTISATFTVPDRIDPTLNDPMEVVDNELRLDSDLELVEAEWIEDE